MPLPRGISKYRITHTPTHFTVDQDYAESVVRSAQRGDCADDIKNQNSIAAYTYKAVNPRIGKKRWKEIKSTHDSFDWGDLQIEKIEPEVPVDQTTLL